MRVLPLFVLLPSFLLMQCAAPRGGEPRPRSGPAPASDERDVLRRAVGDVTEGFRIDAFYTDGQRRRGAHLVDPGSGLALDLVTIETAPQAQVCVWTPTSTDRGEPHTQEHLLISKGRKGRMLFAQRHAWLAHGVAWTEPLETCYGLAAPAGEASFVGSLGRLFDALLHPNYTDEEVRREVHHFGVARGEGGKRELLEQGSVYNEMARTWDHPSTPVWGALRELWYGSTHPAAKESGGVPDDIRKLGPDDIARFHREHYQLSRMRAVVTVPPATDVTAFLRGLRPFLGVTAAPLHDGPSGTAPPLPAPRGAAPGTIRILPFPSADETAPGTVALGYPPAMGLTVAQSIGQELVLAELAEGSSSRLARRFDALRAAGEDFGPVSTDKYIANLPGRPASIWLDGVVPSSLTEARLQRLRDIIEREISDAMATDDKAELEAMRERLLARLVEKRRTVVEALESPPELDARGGSRVWSTKLDDALTLPGTDKSLLFEGPLAEVEALVRATGNPFRNVMASLPVGHVSTVVAASRPSAALRRSIDEASAARKQEEIARLVKVAGVATAEEALAHLEAERAKAGKELAAIEAGDPPVEKAPALPMTLDDGVTFRQRRVGNVPVIDVPFETMTVASVGVGLALDRIPEDLLPFLSLLPTFLREAGLREGDRVLPHDEVDARLHRETRAVSMQIHGEWEGHPELVVKASGLGREETERALGWLRRLLENADWDLRNLETLRALVDREEAALLARPVSPEERWVPEVREALTYGSDPAIVHTGVPFAAAHDAHRIAWMLASSGKAEDKVAVERVLGSLARATRGLSREQLAAMAKALAEGQTSVAGRRALLPVATASAAAAAALRRAGKDLGRRLGDLPDATLHEDVATLLAGMARAYRAGPTEALASMGRLREILLRQSPARAWVVTSSSQESALRPSVDDLLAGFATNVAPPAARRSASILDARVRGRGANIGGAPLGLVVPSMSRATVATSAPAPSYLDSSDDAVLDALGFLLFTGGGATSLYSKTIAAGLAYSNGASLWLESGQAHYYAERTPDPKATLAFVSGIVTGTNDVRPLLASAVTSTFSSRSAYSPEVRGISLARDVTYGRTPERVRRFHEQVLAWSTRPDIAEKVLARKDARFAQIIPGLSPSLNGALRGLQLIVGPESLLAPLDRFLRERTAGAAGVVRIYPRDFWDERPR
jgi:hypothetical protein